MSDLIDRQALKDYVSSLSTHPLNEWDTWGVIAAIDKQPTVAATRWHRVEEPPKEGTWCVIAKHSYLQPHNLFYDIAHYLHGTFSVYDSGIGDWFDGKPLYWMPIEPPKEDA